MPKSVGFIGLGNLGSPIAANLLNAGYELFVHNRTIAKADALVACGAKRADRAADAVTPGGIVVTLLWDDASVKDVVTSNDFRGRWLNRGQLLSGAPRHRGPFIARIDERKIFLTVVVEAEGRKIACAFLQPSRPRLRCGDLSLQPSGDTHTQPFPMERITCSRIDSQLANLNHRWESGTVNSTSASSHTTFANPFAQDFPRSRSSAEIPDTAVLACIFSRNRHQT
jgi:hypothetical protein